MRSEDGYIYTQRDLDGMAERQANQMKDFIVGYLEDQKLLPDGRKWAERHAILLVRKGRLGQLIDKWLKLEAKEDLTFAIVQMTD
jgi:hypothetical protein